MASKLETVGWEQKKDIKVHLGLFSITNVSRWDEWVFFVKTLENVANGPKRVIVTKIVILIFLPISDLQSAL